MPNEQAVSMHTPVYTLPFSVNIAADTAPASINGDIFLGFTLLYFLQFHIIP